MFATRGSLTRQVAPSRALSLGQRSTVGIRGAHRPVVCFQCTSRDGANGMVASSRRCIASRATALGGQRRGMMSAMAVEGEEEIHEMEFQDEIKGPWNLYQQRVSEGELRNDGHQRGIVMNLQKLHDDLQAYYPPTVVHPTSATSRASLFGSLFGLLLSTTIIPKYTPKGMYLFGDVGAGKTMLMDMFFNSLPPHITTKTRIHFHNFMQDVHKRLHRLKMQYGNDFDAIPFVGADIAANASVLCFDEFQCTDITNAMILRRLLESLMSHGVVMVVTSNRHPDDLYKDGIQRPSFLPCIELLKTSLSVININSTTDYRKLPRPASGVYHHPLGSGALAHADKWFTHLGDPEDPPKPKSHTIWNREVKVPMASGRAARFKFDELCGSPTSAADYLELCEHYRAFVVEDVPAMDHRSRDLARRFITFVDAVYEKKAKLVLTTTTPLHQLFVSEAEMKAAADEEDTKKAKDSSTFSSDEERFAFERALSRLSEMGSVKWVERE